MTASDRGLPGSQPLPERLGRYPIHGLLGKGSIGLVYKAHDPFFDRAIALKAIRRELLNDEEEAAVFREMFRIEAQAGGRLKHRGIVAVYEYDEDGGYPFIAMEYVGGCSLRQVLRAGIRFPVRDVVTIMAQLLDALEHAHERGVWHRRIKPADLLVTSDGRVKLADFSCAHVEGVSRALPVGAVIGSPGFIAPEQLLGKEVDHRVDLFAAGVVLCDLLTGKMPFSGTRERIFYSIQYEEAQPPSILAGDPALARFDSVTLRALKHPQRRYQSASEFRADLLATWARPVGETLSLEALAQMARLC